MSNNDLMNMTYNDLKTEEKRLSERLARVQSITKAYEGPVPAIPPAVGSATSFISMNTHDAVVSLLKESGKTLKTKEISVELEKRGKKSSAKEPMVSLYNGLVGATERQNSELLNLGDGVWGLKGRDEAQKYI